MMYRDLEGNIVTPNWQEVDWEKFEEQHSEEPVPKPVFRPNRYPYQLPSRPGETSLQQHAQHWIMWYFRKAYEHPQDLPDEVIDADVRRELQAVMDKEEVTSADYIWYRNPVMSAPELFHVQVFWIVPV